jgi:hypothetical protein
MLKQPYGLLSLKYGSYQPSFYKLFVVCRPPSTSYTYPLQVLANVNRQPTTVRILQGQKEGLELNESVPSWVARWDDGIDYITAEIEKQSFGRTLLPFEISGGPSKFLAGGKGYTGPVCDPTTPYEISLRGFVFAEVTAKVNICRLPPLSRPRLWDFVLEIWSIQQDKHIPYPTGENMDEAFAQTLTMSGSNPTAQGEETYHGIDFQHFCVAIYEHTVSIFLKEGRAADIEHLNKEWKEEYCRLQSLVKTHTILPTFSNDLQKNLIGRTLFATKSGYMGIGDNALEPGDLVCVLLGGRTPYILRPAEGRKYRFIGECYLHGIMYGEALIEGLTREELFTLV